MGESPTASPPTHPAASRLSGESGAATSLSIALLTPIFVVLVFAAVQAALWSHAKTEARVIARDTAALVARSGVTVGVTQSPGIVAVTVSANAPGIIRGTSSSFSVTAAVPVEELTPP